MGKPEEALKLAEEITAKRAELKALEAVFFSLFNSPPKKDADTHSPVEELPQGASVTDTMRWVFRSNRGKVVTVPDFIKALPSGTPIKTVRSTVNRIVTTSDGRIVTVTPGQYKLLED